MTKARRTKEVCYIRLHERGMQAQMANAFVSSVLGRR